MTEQQSPSLYERLGGEQGVHRLVDAFYQIMDSRPDTAGIRALHPEDISSSNQRLFMYFSGWFGGPPLFTDAYGHPRLRARHLPFKIDVSERDQWLLCMAGAFKQIDLDMQLAEDLWEKIAPMADHMRNQDDPSVSCSAEADSAGNGS